MLSYQAKLLPPNEKFAYNEKKMGSGERMGKKLFITRKLPNEVIEPLQAKYDVEMWDKEDVVIPRHVLLEKVKDAEGLMTMLSEKVDEELFQHAPKLKVVANMAVGYDNIDIQAAERANVIITNTPDVLTESTADLTFSLLLATARRMIEAAEYVKNNQWKSWSPLLLAGHDVHRKTIGIVGMGSIGEVVAKRAKGFDMHILYYNRSRKKRAEEELHAQYVSFEELVSQSDFIVCLTPLTTETKNLFTKEVFQQMKPSAIFVNASRGPVVNEDDLYSALVEGEIAGAGLDVFSEEPISGEHPLLQLKQVVALPHIGSATTETRYKMMELCVQNIDRVFSDGTPLTPVK
ncbi:glyoxylate reductase [Cytobacillus kochii]|nr:glyoxylate reductase [Cytobacillus kochii]